MCVPIPTYYPKKTPDKPFFWWTFTLISWDLLAGAYYWGDWIILECRFLRRFKSSTDKILKLALEYTFFGNVHKRVVSQECWCPATIHPNRDNHVRYMTHDSRHNVEILLRWCSKLRRNLRHGWMFQYRSDILRLSCHNGPMLVQRSYTTAAVIIAASTTFPGHGIMLLKSFKIVTVLLTMFHGDIMKGNDRKLGPGKLKYYKANRRLQEV